MFAGVGGFRAGLTKAGGFECIGHSEIDKYADASYRAIHSPKESEVFYPDARAIEPSSMPDFDLLCGGFPCQSFSLAGRRKGFEDVRGTLFFELARIAAAKRPKYLLFENVPGLLSHDKGKTFAVILDTICELGYCVEWMVLNSKDHGVPQARRRVFIVGCLDERCCGQILPFADANPKALVRIAGQGQGQTIYDGEGVACTQTTNGKTGLYLINNTRKNVPQGSRIYDAKGLACTQTAGAGGKGGKTGLYFIDMCKGDPCITEHARCITARQDSGLKKHKGEVSGVLEVEACAVLTPDREKVRQNGRRIKSPGEPMFTLTTQDKHGVLLIKEATRKGYKEAHEGDSVDLGYAGSNTRRGRIGRDIAHTLDTGSTQGVVRQGKIRRLTPRECFRLQGFEDEQIDKILAITSDAQAYKQAGNAVTVNVIEAIGRRLKSVDDMLKGGEAA